MHFIFCCQYFKKILFIFNLGHTCRENKIHVDIKQRQKQRQLSIYIYKWESALIVNDIAINQVVKTKN